MTEYQRQQLMQPPFHLRRDKHGYAEAIDNADGVTVVHLTPGTLRNETEGGAQAVVDMLNDKTPPPTK